MTAGLPPGIHSDHVNGPRQGTSPFYFLICILRKQTISLKYPSGLDSATVDSFPIMELKVVKILMAF